MNAFSGIVLLLCVWLQKYIYSF